VTPYSDVEGYHTFGEPRCLHLPKRWHPNTTLHGVKTQKDL